MKIDEKCERGKRFLEQRIFLFCKIARKSENRESSLIEYKLGLGLNTHPRIHEVAVWVGNR